MKLSVVIVNYNVKYFLEQALLSITRALQEISSEIIVIDNASSDGSAQMLSARFPQVRLLRNEENLGFAKANNQGAREASGEFILFINPDTVVEEDTLSKCVAFMDVHPDAGALGVKMIDGTGKFLPESKRGLPTLWVSFCKLTGLSKLFPKSRTFNRYHLGYLDPNRTHEVDVLAGAFMMVRKKVLDEVGPFDERFFMYGEDVDLSYRITKAGYKNYYFPQTSIIHYKGESTKKGSLNYVRMFYLAMIVFAEKHFAKGSARFFRLAIRGAIYGRAAFAAVGRVVSALWLPVVEAGLSFLGIYFIKEFYARQVKDAAEYYPEEFMYYIVPVYVTIWIVSIFFSGGYDKPLRIGRALRGVFVGAVLIAALYGFLPESLRYSRAIIILGAAWAGFLAIVMRGVVLMMLNRSLSVTPARSKRLAIVGSADEGQRVLNMVNQTSSGHNFIGFISPDQSNGQPFIGDLDELDDLAEVYELDEVIFCARDVSAQKIIHWMTRAGTSLNYKIVPEDGLGIIGSNSKNAAGDLYALDVNLAIRLPGNRRSKRLFDLAMCLVLLILAPVSVLMVKRVGGFIQNWFHVLIGVKSWVGYATVSDSVMTLPPIKPGVLDTSTLLRDKQLDQSALQRLNLLYAREYTVRQDATIVWRALRELGQITSSVHDKAP